ncbi:hypothetical protein GC173_11405 [bacterium]|nr:hypothetical protein [bacterium]
MSSLRVESAGLRRSLVEFALHRAGVLRMWQGLRRRTKGVEVEEACRLWACTDAALLAQWPSLGRAGTVVRLYEAAAAIAKGEVGPLLGQAQARTGNRRSRALGGDEARWAAEYRRWRMQFPNAPTLTIWRQLADIAADEGVTAPTRGWVYRQEERMARDRSLMLQATGGERGLKQNGPYIRMDRSAVVPGAEYVMDNRQLDLMAVGAGGAPIRPWITMIVDHRTLAPMGWCVTEAAPNRHSIMVAMQMAMLPKEGLLSRVLGEARDYLCGLPKLWIMDNGKDFNAKAIIGSDRKGISSRRKRDEELMGVVSGLAGDLGCGMRRSLPYNPRAKVVERFFRDMSLGFDVLSAGHWGNTPEARTAPARKRYEIAAGLAKEGVLSREEIAKRSGLPLLEKVCEALEAFAWKYWLREDGVGDGLRIDGRAMSPLAVFRKFAEVPRSLPSPQRLERWGMEVSERLVSRGYLRVDGRVYGGVQLARLDGLKVQVRWSELDHSFVLVEAVVGEAPLPQVLRVREAGAVEFGDEQATAAAMETMAAHRRVELAAAREATGEALDPLGDMVRRVRAAGEATGRGQVAAVPGRVYTEIFDIRDDVVDAAPLGRPVSDVPMSVPEGGTVYFPFQNRLGEELG